MSVLIRFRITASRAALLAMTLCAAVLPLPLLLTGCGGSGSESAPPLPASTGQSRGRASFTIVWPERTRLIPSASNSIIISLYGAGPDAPLVGSEVIARPASGQGSSTAAFDSLEPASLVAKASAFPSSDGTGTAQASGQVPIMIVGGETAQASLTMDSTIDRLEVSPPVLLFRNAKPGELTAPITITARNAANEVVLVTPDTIRWTRDAPSSTRVQNTPQGGYVVFAPHLVGVTTFTFRETESNRTIPLPVEVRGPSYTVTDLNPRTDPVAYRNSETVAMNNTGLIAGYISLNSRRELAVWENGTRRALGMPPGLDSIVVQDINDAGLIVGHGSTSEGTAPGFSVSRGFIWTPTPEGGTFQIVSPPPGFSSIHLFGVNNRQEAVGYHSGTSALLYDIPSQTTTTLPLGINVNTVAFATNDSGAIVGGASSQGAFLFQNETTTLIPGMGTARGINAAGDIIGSQTSYNRSSAVLYQNNRLTRLFPEDTASDSLPNRINNRGEIVGSWSGHGAFVWGPGISGIPGVGAGEDLNHMIDPSSGWYLGNAWDINDQGQIVCIGSHNGTTGPALLTPIP
ncbi:MAG: hypothetical protein H7Z41_05265 [Cytophagales bacterium]|nr:hypothetical protein [Armatimonadota bacterium]